MKEQLKADIWKRIQDARLNYQRILQEEARFNTRLWEHASAQGMRPQDLEGRIYSSIGTRKREAVSAGIHDFTRAEGLKKRGELSLLSFYRVFLVHNIQLPEDLKLDYVTINEKLKRLCFRRANMMAPADALEIYWSCNLLSTERYQSELERVQKALEDYAQGGHVHEQQNWTLQFTQLGKRFVKGSNPQEIIQNLCNPTNLKDAYQWRAKLAQELRALIVTHSTCTDPPVALRQINVCLQTPLLRPMSKRLKALLQYQTKQINTPLPGRNWFLQLAASLQLTAGELENLLYCAGYEQTSENDPCGGALSVFLDAERETPSVSRGTAQTKGVLGRSLPLYQPSMEYCLDLDQLSSLLVRSNSLNDVHLFSSFPTRMVSGDVCERICTILLACCGTLTVHQDGRYSIEFCWDRPFPVLYEFFQFSAEEMKGYGTAHCLIPLLRSKLAGERCVQQTLPSPGEEGFEEVVAAVRTALERLPEERPGEQTAMCGFSPEEDSWAAGGCLFAAMMEVILKNHYPLELRRFSSEQLGNVLVNAPLYSIERVESLARELLGLIEAGGVVQ